MPSKLSNEGLEVLEAEVFLDTSIFCCLQKGPLFRGRVKDFLGKFCWKSTSTYAQVEYGNVVLAQAEYYLRKLSELESLAKVLDFIGNVLHQRSHSQKITWSFNLLRRHYGKNDKEQTERAVLTLRRLMKLGVKFVTQVCDDPIEDGTHCYWAKNGVKRKRDGTLIWQAPQCKRNNKRCTLDDFFIANKDKFIEIKSAIDAIPQGDKSAQLANFSVIIGRAEEDPASLLDYRTNCKLMADAIIAIDSAGYSNMFSQNLAESKVLCQVLGQVFYYLPPNPEHEIQKHEPAPAG